MASFLWDMGHVSLRWVEHWRSIFSPFPGSEFVFCLEHFCCVRSEHVTVPLVSSYGFLSYLLATRSSWKDFFRKCQGFKVSCKEHIGISGRDFSVYDVTHLDFFELMALSGKKTKWGMIWHEIMSEFGLLEPIVTHWGVCCHQIEVKA